MGGYKEEPHLFYDIQYNLHYYVKYFEFSLAEDEGEDHLDRDHG